MDRDTAIDKRRHDFGRRLFDLRTRAGLPQDAIANAAGLHRVTYVRVEGGQANVSLDKVGPIADALGVALGELFADLP